MTPRKHLLSPHQAIAGGYYHCISKVVSPQGVSVARRNFVFGDREREVFGRVLRQVEAFAGVRVLTWTVLSNHFHVLVHVPVAPAGGLPGSEVLERCRQLYEGEALAAIEEEFAVVERVGGAALERWCERYLRRMWDLSEFLKTLKQKFTQWFNRRHVRQGTLWERRFKSVLVEGEATCLLKVAAYIDLNAVRAGLCDDPKDYRWCGYAEAVAGVSAARGGLVAAMRATHPRASWRRVSAAYRKVMFGLGEASEQRHGLTREAIAKVWAEGGELSLQQLLRCRVRYLSDGVALGSREFAERFFRARREMFDPARRTGARELAGGDWGGVCALRSFRNGVWPPMRGAHSRGRGGDP